MRTRVIINSMSFLVEQVYHTNPLLILSDSLLRGFRIREADLISIKGTRPQDLEVFLNDKQIALNNYKVGAIVCGGNCFKEKMKNGICRPNCSPFCVVFLSVY